MRVAIAGGHGQIALRLARLLHERGDAVRSLIRKAEQTDAVGATGAEPVICDLEAVSADELAQAIGDVNAVVFAAGAGPGSGSARKDTMDYGGAVKLIEAAKLNGIDRYVMISAVGAHAATKGDDTFSVYLRAKGRADDELVNSGLDYTVVRPVRLTDEPGDGLVDIGEHVTRRTVSRDNIAAVVAATLHEPASIGKVFVAADGDRPIEEAIRQL